MAKYDITYSCGHIGTELLVGPEKQRRSRIDWLESKGLCPACKQAATATKRAAEAVVAAEAAAAAGLPALNDGSEKQIAWAERIRAAALTESDPAKHWGMLKYDAHSLYAAIIAAKRANDDRTEFDARKKAVMDAGIAALGKLTAQTSARWWIDHRDDLDGMVRKAMIEASKREFEVAP